jgi:protein-S-isoprenylcysteine O-methyltransferase Ste14
MELSGHFQPALSNAWPMCLPLIGSMAYVAAKRRDVARRMADLDGYSSQEKAIAIAASLAPYPFMVATIFTPLTPIVPLLALAFSLYLPAVVGFLLTLRVFMATPLSEPLTAGPFRLSRNPLYVSATAVFVSICLATASPLLTLWLVPLVLLQHLMIVGEERVCRDRFGATYESYCRSVPRYLAWRERNR